MIPGQFFKNDPVLQEVMRKYGLLWEDFVQKKDGNHYIPSGDDHRPEITFSSHDATYYLRISWDATETKVRYEINHDAIIISIEPAAFPEARLQVLPGIPASDVIEIPGFEQLVIEEVMNRCLGESRLEFRMLVKAKREGSS